MSVSTATQDFPPAITDLAVAGDIVSWWQDAPSGSGLVSLRGPCVPTAHSVLSKAIEERMWMVIGCTPGPAGWHAVVVGRPGADYGYLCCVDDDSTVPDEPPSSFPLVRRPSIVWAPDGMSFVYPRFGLGLPPDHVPPDGIEVAVHRIGTKFRSDEVLLPRQAAHTLVVLEPSAATGRCLLRVADGQRSDYYLLDYSADHPGGPRVNPLVQNASARTQVLPGHTRWWVATGLGTERSTLLALPVGSLDRTAAEEITLRVGGNRVHPAFLRASRNRLAVRALSTAGEHVVTVDADTLEQHVVAGDTPGCTVSQLAASVTGSVIAWTELAPREDGGSRLRVRSLVDDVEADAAKTCVEQSWPAAAPVSVRWYVTEDGTKLPMYVSRGPNVAANAPVVVLAHGGTSGLLNAPLERALELRCVQGEVVVVRVVTRTLRLATESDGGRRAYNDLLAAARKARQTVANGHQVSLIGYSMGAVSAARAVLTDPAIFRCAALRFPVADLLRFPELGIGRHWVPMLGNPGESADRDALRHLSPCHMPSSGRPMPPVLLQVGRFDSRAHPEHGRRLFERLRREPGSAPDLSEFAMGHLERLGSPETARAVEETVRFVLTRTADTAG